MAPPSTLAHSAIPSDFDESGTASTNGDSNDHHIPFPPLTRSSTVPANLTSPTRRADPSHLAPEDAFLAASPPRRANGFEPNGRSLGGHGSGSDIRPRRHRIKDGTSRSRSRRRKRFQKLLWVKQSCTRIHSIFGVHCLNTC
jgi:phosphatidylinositol N-acetylglucosaminyltransferase subunit C